MGVDNHGPTRLQLRLRKDFASHFLGLELMATISNTFDYFFDYSFIYGGTNGTRSPDPPFVGDENSEAVNKMRYVNKN